MMRFNSLTTFFKARFRRWAVLGALALTFTGLSSFSTLNPSVMAAPLYNFPVVAASSAANQVKGQVDKADRAIGDAKDKLDREDVAKTRASVKDAKSTAAGKVKRDLARTQEGAEDAKAAVASRAKQDASRTEVSLEKAGNKAEEFASNVLDTAKNLIGQ
jgi:hypothetical protein